MTQEDKQLLLVDLCARIPYWVKVKVRYYYEYKDGTFQKYDEIKYFDAEILDLLISGDRSLDAIKPYLRPLSSMTEEEQKEFVKFHCVNICPIVLTENLTISNEAEMFDWLNKKMFDYRGLIQKGLAISTEEFNPYKD